MYAASFGHCAPGGGSLVIFGRIGWLRGALVLLLGVFPWGCGTAEGDPAGESGGAAGDAGVVHGQLEFGPCPSDLPGARKERHCATVALPLRAASSEGPTIDVMVVMYEAASPSRGQLFLLDGGPGGTGATYMSDEMLALYRELGLTIFIPQHRGTGHSTPLHCTELDDLEACSRELVEEWGEGLRAMSSSEAAEDLYQLIELARVPGEPVFVLGISYGTYWAQRFLSRHPAEVDGVMMDGILPLDANLTESDPLAQEAGLRLLEDCTKVPFCRSALDDDPLATVNLVMDTADDPETRCLGDNGLTRRDLSILFSMMMALDVPYLVPATVLRLHRCSASDTSELLTLIGTITEVLGQGSEVDWERMNPVLQYHVVRTDILSDLASIDATRLIAARDALIVRSAAASVEWFDELLAGWVVNYPSEPRELVPPTTPVLLMNGTYDVQTPLPWVDELAQRYQTTGVTVPSAGHAVDISLWMANPASLPCSLSIKQAFVQDPGSRLDLSCLDQIPLSDFAAEREGTQTYAELFFGTHELLPRLSGGTPSARRIRAPGALSPETLRRQLRERFKQIRWGLPSGSRFRT